MQQLSGTMRRAVAQYHMLEDGDHLAVGVSGGKDSVAMLTGLALLRNYIGISYTLTALTLDPCFDGKETDYSPIAELCERLSVPYVLKRTQIGPIVFEGRSESNPCSLCARMRRGALHNLCKEAGANKLALGHNRNDAIETFVMNLTQEGRIGCFSPVTWMSRKQLTVIRPMIFAQEKDILGAVRREKLPVVKSLCPVNGQTHRQRVKEALAEQDRKDHGFSERLFGAMCRAHVDGW